MAPAAPWACWRDAAAYAPLLRLGPAALAWDWLRRDGAYRAAAAEAVRRRKGARGDWIAEEPAAERWALHAFEDPDLAAPSARPVWRAPARPLLIAAAERVPARPDLFDVGRFAGLATLVRAGDGCEHLLLSDGASDIRLDLVEGSLTAGPVLLRYRLEGLAGLDGALADLRRLTGLWRSGRLPPPRRFARAARLVRLLRAADALAGGAAQREIAAVLLSRQALERRWRSEAPSLRSQAQRLVAGARRMGAGGWRALLAPERGSPG